MKTNDWKRRFLCGGGRLIWGLEKNICPGGACFLNSMKSRPWQQWMFTDGIHRFV